MKMKKYNSNDIRVFDAFCTVISENRNLDGSITLSKIAEVMGITRQALTKTYYHSVKEIIAALHDYVNQEAYVKMETFIASKQKGLSAFLITEFFPTLYRKKKYLYVLYNKASDPAWLAFMIEKYTRLLCPYFSEAAKKLDLEPAFVTKNVVCVVISSLSHWLSKAEPEPPKTFGKEFKILLRHSFLEIVDA